jgi:ribosome-associated translation inhibitor RaiA
MAVSDQLTKLAARAKEAEDRAASAQGKTRADLERDVEQARTSAMEQADKLRATADAKKGKLSVWWHDVQRSWDQHIEKIRADFEEKRAEGNVDRAQMRAENAEDDAAFAIDFAYAAIEEAEYAALDASLARMQADELAAVPARS